MIENGVPNTKEAKAPYYVRVHTQDDIFHVVSFIINALHIPQGSKNSIARAAVQAVVNATQIEVWDLNDLDPQWRKQ